MKYQVFPPKSADGSSVGYEYFAQALDEMLFDYTLDTYKPSTHNASTLIREALSILDDVKSGLIDGVHFDEVIKELKWMISIDPVAKNLINANYERLLAGVTAEQPNVAKSRLSLFATALSLRKYSDLCMQQLSLAISGGREKKEIRATTRQLVTTLLRAGYTRRYLRKRTNELFFNASPDADLKKCLTDFFLSFNFEAKKFRLCAKGSHLFQDIKESMEELKWRCDCLPPNFLGPDEIRLLDSQLPVYLSHELEALDAFAARKMCDEMLGRVANFFSVFHHKQTLTWGAKMWVGHAAADDKDAHKPGNIVGRPSPAITRVIDAMPKKAAKKMRLAFSELRMNDEGLQQFSRVVELHGAAVKSIDANVQLLNLWSALEATVPDSLKGSTVSNVIETLKPFLVIGYARAIFEDLWLDVYKWDRGKAATYLGLEQGSRLGHGGAKRMAELLLLTDMNTHREQLLADLRPYSLLYNRCHTIIERFGTPKALLKTCAQHQTKIGWQIRRIYRTRNLYVHAGRSVRMIDSLIENAHCYLDAYLNRIFEMAKEKPRPLSPEQGWVLATERERAWEEELKGSSAFTVDNVALLVLGQHV